MKRNILFLLIISFTLFSCGKKKSEELVIKNYEKEYNFSLENSLKPRYVLANELIRNEVKNKVPLQKIKGENVAPLKVRLFIGKNGKLDHLKFIDKPSYVGNEMEKQIVDALLGFDYSKIFPETDSMKKSLDVEIFGDNFEKEFSVKPDEWATPAEGVYSIFNKISYPEQAKKEGVEGKVFVKAFINEKGDVVKTKILKGIGYGCDEEAAKAITETKFIPAKLNGKPVKTTVIIPVFFKLQ